jgi:signal peptidase I
LSVPPVKEQAAPETDSPKSKRSLNSLLEFVLIVVVALGLALGIQAWVVKPFRIPSGSMEPTLDIGQRVLVDRITGHFGDPSRGDVVVFHPPKGADNHGNSSCGVPHRGDEACPMGTKDRSEANFIKRVVAVGGDRVKVLHNRAYVNGKLQKDSFARLTPCDPPVCDLPKEITVPAGQFFMMGDNRGQSDDSRDWGPVPKKWVVGEAFFTYWPPKRIGTL